MASSSCCMAPRSALCSGCPCEAAWITALMSNCLGNTTLAPYRGPKSRIELAPIRLVRALLLEINQALSWESSMRLRRYSKSVGLAGGVCPQSSSLCQFPRSEEHTSELQSLRHL